LENLHDIVVEMLRLCFPEQTILSILKVAGVPFSGTFLELIKEEQAGRRLPARALTNKNR